MKPELQRKLGAREPVRFQYLLRGSVQLWAYRIEKLGLQPILGGQELYSWPHEYDARFLGYMAGILDLQDFLRAGGRAI